MTALNPNITKDIFDNSIQEFDLVLVPVNDGLELACLRMLKRNITRSGRTTQEVAATYVIANPSHRQYMRTPLDLEKPLTSEEVRTVRADLTGRPVKVDDPKILLSPLAGSLFAIAEKKK